MRLPRRVPWTSIAELDQLCAWIYTDESDLDSKIHAVNRLSAWRAITALPHALDSALALLSVIVQDASNPKPISFLSLRQSYAAALLRLVNGLVDPLQRGLYARSVASIAGQIGLPAWFVDLRHAATHEDLPSLGLLRQAAREGMTWLLHNYFLPTLNPSTAAAPQPAPLRPLAPVLRDYKSLRKIVTRDASLQSQHQPQIKTILRDVERWIAEAMVAANVAAGELEWGSASQENGKEWWALERLCDALMEKGALVPLSKKKRVFPKDAFLPPPAAVSVWAPLLSELQDTHADFPAVFAHRVVARLFAAPAPDAPAGRDPTYDACLARWAQWVLDTLQAGADSELRKDTVAGLVTRLGPAHSKSADTQAATALLHALCQGNAELEAAVSFLQPPGSGSSSQGKEWSQDDISIMHERLAALLGAVGTTPEPDAAASGAGLSADVDMADPNAATEAALPPGWRLLGANSNWKPCPIGVYVAG